MPRYSDEKAPIKRADMMPLMLKACPGFRSQWDDFLAEWRDTPDMPLYLAIGDLARYVIDLVDRQDISLLPAIFDVVERWHVEGEHYVREAAVIGFLEGIMNWGENDKVFEQHFGPETARYWKKLSEYWSSGTIITDD